MIIQKTESFAAGIMIYANVISQGIILLISQESRESEIIKYGRL